MSKGVSSGWDGTNQGQNLIEFHFDIMENSIKLIPVTMWQTLHGKYFKTCD